MKSQVYFFITAILLFSCKVNDEFSVHKRKYNPGFYIEKNNKPENLQVRAKSHKPPGKTHEQVEIKNLDRESIALNSTIERNTVPTKNFNEKTSFARVQQDFIEREKSVLRPGVDLSGRKTILGSKRDAESFFRGVLIFLAVVIILLGIAMLGTGIYFLVLASTSTYATGATTSYALSLIGYGCLILGVAATLYRAFK